MRQAEKVIEQNEEMYIKTFKLIIEAERLIEEYHSEIARLSYLNDQHIERVRGLKLLKEAYRPDGMGE